MNEWSDHPLLLRAGEASAEASRLLKRWDACAHFPGIRKSTKKAAPFSPALIRAAQEVVTEQEDLSTIYDYDYGVLSVLALDGSPESAAALARHYERIADDSADVLRLQEILKTLGSSDEVRKVSARATESVEATASLTEAAAWGARHAPKLKPGWSFALWADEHDGDIWFGAGQTGPRVNLNVDPQDAPSSRGWEVIIRAPHGEPSIREPGPETLEQFPVWLRETAARLGVTFNVEGCQIIVGRHRSLDKIVREWLVEGYGS